MKFYWLFAAAILGCAFLLLTAPFNPRWGQRHTGDLKKGTLQLRIDNALEQSFRWEYAALDTVMLWLAPDQSLPSTGGLLLEVRGPDSVHGITIPFAAIPPSGVVPFRLPQPITAAIGTTGTFRVTLHESSQPIRFSYQPDSGKYPDGALIYSRGDLAFQLHYQHYALGNRWLHGGYAVVMVIAGIVVVLWWRTASPGQDHPSYQRFDFGIAAVLFLGTATWYALFLVFPAGWWVGPGDFVKDVAYLTAGQQAFRASAWPVWSHLTCGGMPLLANPESNIFSIGSVFAFFLDPERALLLLVSLEAGIAAGGVYLLSRTLGLRRVASIGAALIATLGGGYAYRLVEGFTMVGGAVAFTPWVFLGLVQAVVRHSKRWLWVSGTAVAFIFLRGEVHIIVGVILLASLFLVTVAVARRSWQPLFLLLVFGSIAFLYASPKLLAYVEQRHFFKQDFHPYVVPLIADGLLDDAFLKIHDSTKPTAVRYGEQPEHWGNFGAYVGILPLLLAGLGLFSRHRYRWWIIAGALLSFLLSEGWFFATVLRHLPPLDVLLRVPTRLLAIFVIFLGLLAAAGLDLLPRWTRYGLVLLMLINLGNATATVFLQNTGQRTNTALPAPEQPTLAAHGYQSPDDTRYAGTLLRSGYWLPNLCADFNNEPSFVSSDVPVVPLTNVSTQAAPNYLILSAVPAATQLTVYEQFSSQWWSAHAVVLEEPLQTLSVTHSNLSPLTITVQYFSGLTRVEQALFGLMIVSTIFYLLPKRSSVRHSLSVL